MDPSPNGYPQPGEEAEVLKRPLGRLVTESGKRVLLLGHSSGAFAATVVAVPELHVKTRKANGTLGEIIGILELLLAQRGR